MPPVYTAILAIIYTVGMAFAILIFARSTRRLPVAYDLIYAAMDEAAVALDLDNLILSANPSAERLFGKSSADMIQRPITDFLSPERGFPAQIDQAEVFDCALESGLICQGQILPMMRGKTLVGRLVMLRDISAQRQAETRLRANEQRAKALLDSLPDMMFRFDDEGGRAQIVAQFIQTTLQEFDNTVSSIKGTAYLLWRYETIEKRTRKLKQIQTQTLHLNTLIDRLTTPHDDAKRL